MLSTAVVAIPNEGMSSLKVLQDEENLSRGALKMISKHMNALSFSMFKKGRGSLQPLVQGSVEHSV